MVMERLNSRFPEKGAEAPEHRPVPWVTLQGQDWALPVEVSRGLSP